MKTIWLTLCPLLFFLVTCQTTPTPLPPVATADVQATVNHTLTQVALTIPPTFSPVASPAATADVEATVNSKLTQVALALPTATRTVKPSLTPSPTSQPSLTPTSKPLPPATMTLPPAGLTIFSFTADKTYLHSGDEVTFTWSSNGTKAGITVYLPTQYLGQGWADLPPSGSLTFEATGYNFYGYALTVYDAAGQTVTSDPLQIRFYCATTYFFDPTPDPDLCPSEVNTLTAAAQPFEHGRMLWLDGGVDGDGVARADMIFVLYADGTLTAFLDTWREGDPLYDPTIIPPAGFYQPVRGFGRVWREEAAVRDKLGWATAEEQAYLAQQQYGPLVDLKGSTMYLSLPNGQTVVKLLNHYAWYGWELVRE